MPYLVQIASSLVRHGKDKNHHTDSSMSKVRSMPGEKKIKPQETVVRNLHIVAEALLSRLNQGRQLDAVQPSALGIKNALPGL